MSFLSCSGSVEQRWWAWWAQRCGLFWGWKLFFALECAGSPDSALRDVRCPSNFLISLWFYSTHCDLLLSLLFLVDSGHPSLLLQLFPLIQMYYGYKNPSQGMDLKPYWHAASNSQYIELKQVRPLFNFLNRNYLVGGIFWLFIPTFRYNFRVPFPPRASSTLKHSSLLLWSRWLCWTKAFVVFCLAYPPPTSFDLINMFK